MITESLGRTGEITKSVKKKDWGWYATGPVHSVQPNEASTGALGHSLRSPGRQV